MTEINALSLFDGMSCAQIALEQTGFKVKEYRASEIDKHAIKVTMTNYPNTIQLGDVRNVKGDELPFQDIILGGSPCTGFSKAGKRLNFDDPQSKLFFEFVRILGECRIKNPEIKFLLENVVMLKDYEKIITKILGVNPININSSLVSAQNRERLYWTNIGTEAKGLFGHQESIIQQPKDERIFLKDILEEDVPEKYTLKNGWAKWFEENKEYQLKKGYSSLDSNKSICLTARQYASWNGNYVTQLNPSLESGGKQPYMQNRIYDTIGKSVSLTKFSDRLNVRTNEMLIRRLTPLECERLQTIPDNYSNCVSDSARYEMLGNGWTIKVIKHILSYWKK